MSSIVFRSPTGGWLTRPSDDYGNGAYGASRKRTRNDRTERYTHRGVDLYIEAGQPVFAPTVCEVHRHIQCYPDTKEFTGLELDAAWCRVKILYVAFDPAEMAVGRALDAGETIGKAQELRERYPSRPGRRSITPHIHFEFTRIDPAAVWATASLIRKAEELARELRNI